MDSYYLEITIFVALLLNLVAAIQVIKSDEFEKMQKVAQIVLVLLIPFIASVGIILFLRSQQKPTVASKSNAGKGHCSIDASGGD